MDSWHAIFLGRRHLPRELTAFEVEVFFQFSAEKAWIIEERRRPELKFGLALQIGFLRMSGRHPRCVADAVTAAMAAFGRAMYRRGSTLIEHQQIACDALGFQWLTGYLSSHSECSGAIKRRVVFAVGCKGYEQSNAGAAINSGRYLELMAQYLCGLSCDGQSEAHPFIQSVHA